MSARACQRIRRSVRHFLKRETCQTPFRSGMNQIRMDGFEKAAKRWKLGQDVQAQQAVHGALGWQVMAHDLDITQPVAQTVHSGECDQRSVLHSAHGHKWNALSRADGIAADGQCDFGRDIDNQRRWVGSRERASRPRRQRRTLWAVNLRSRSRVERRPSFEEAGRTAHHDPCCGRASDHELESWWPRPSAQWRSEATRLCIVDGSDQLGAMPSVPNFDPNIAHRQGCVKKPISRSSVLPFFSLLVLLAAYGLLPTASSDAATEFVSTIKASGGDYTSLVTWDANGACDLTAATRCVYEVRPTACRNLTSTSRWMLGPTRPSFLRISARWRVKSFPNRNTEVVFSPVSPNSEWVVGKTQSVSVSSGGMTEERKATTTSRVWGSGEMITDGLTFRAVRSVNGKGTSTMSPRASAIDSDGFSVRGLVEVLRRIVKEAETLSLHGGLADQERRGIILGGEHRNQDPLMICQADRDQRLQHAVLIDCRNRSRHLSLSLQG